MGALTSLLVMESSTYLTVIGIAGAIVPPGGGAGTCAALGAIAVASPARGSGPDVAASPIGPIGPGVDDDPPPGAGRTGAAAAVAGALGTIKIASATMFPLAPLALKTTVIFPLVTV